MDMVLFVSLYQGGGVGTFESGRGRQRSAAVQNTGFRASAHESVPEAVNMVR